MKPRIAPHYAVWSDFHVMVQYWAVFLFLIIYYFTYKGTDQETTKMNKKKSHLSPDPVKKTVGIIEAGSGGPVGIRGVLTLLFWKS